MDELNFWDELVEGLEDVGVAIADWLPRIIVALLVLIIGRWIAKLVRRIVRRLLESRPVGGVMEAAGINQMLQGTEYTAAAISATVIYAFLMVIVYLIVAQVLTIEPIVDLLQQLIAFLPLVVVAIAIVVISAAVGSFAANLVRPFAERRNLAWLATATRVGVIVFGVVTALDLLKIGFFTNTAFTILVAGGAVAFAIAFGVGGIDTARKWWAKYLAPSDAPGDRPGPPPSGM